MWKFQLRFVLVAIIVNLGGQYYQVCWENKDFSINQLSRNWAIIDEIRSFNSRSVVLFFYYLIFLNFTFCVF